MMPDTTRFGDDPLYTLIDATHGGKHPNARFDTTGNTLDLLPVGSFFISANRPSDGWGFTAMKLVPKPERAASRDSVTPQGRMLHYFWRKIDGEHSSTAVNRWGLANKLKCWRWIVRPGQQGYAAIEAFELACRHVVAIRGEPTPITDAPLWRALGVEQ